MNILIARICRGSWERCEVGDFLVSSFVYAAHNGVNMLLGNVDQEPTTAARNNAVSQALAAGIDILIMVDDDMVPAPRFFEQAVQFWNGGKTGRGGLNMRPFNKDRCVLGSPYCGSPPGRLVQVLDSDLQRMTRQFAMNRSGIGQVRCVGTGLIAIDLRCLSLIEPPYFDYDYTDAVRTNVKWTEDFYFCNRIHEAGGKVWCAWDQWSGHAKTEVVGKPE